VKTGGSNSGAAGPIRLALAGLLALAAAMGIGRFAFTPLLPMMQVDGLSVAQGGWLASANYVGYLLGALSAMRLPLGPATAIRTGLATIVLGTLAMGLTESFALWVVLRTIAGVASAWVLIFVSAWSLEKLAPLRRPLLSASAFAGVGFGIALAGLICVALMHFQVRAPQAWLVLGMMAFVLGAVVWPVFATPAQPVSRRAGATPSSVNWTTESVLMVLCYGAFGFGYIIPATFLPAMARQLVEDPALFGWAWPIFGLAAFFSTLAVAVLQRRIPNRVLWIASELIMAAGVAIPVVWPNIVAIMLSALLVGGTLVVITMVGIQEAREVGGRQAAELIAAMTAAFAAGQIGGPVCVSFLAHAPNGFSIALLFACALLTFSAAALIAPLQKQKASAVQDASRD
jgi:MFS family permease